MDVLSTAHGGFELDRILPWNPKGSTEDKIAEHTASAYLAPLAEAIPDEVIYGYHVCLGTVPAFPATPADDLSIVVDITNRLVGNSAHRVDYVHLPCTKDAGREYFAPLQRLDIGNTKVFLGIEVGDGYEAMSRRISAAREFLPDFGVSHYCGYGRDAEGRMPELLEDLNQGADSLSVGVNQAG
jgi:hypothetical protein